MVDPLRESRLFRELFSLFDNKAKVQGPQLRGIIDAQMRLIKDIDDESIRVFRELLSNLAVHFSTKEESNLLAALEDINASQEKILMDSLRSDLSKIVEKLRSLAATYNKQKEAIARDMNRYGELWSFEQEVMRELSIIINEESNLSKKLEQHLQMVARLEHSDMFIKLIRGVSKLTILGKLNLIVTGQENIPQYGPVIIAPRHFHGDYDGRVMQAIARRRTFFLAANEWMKEGITLKIAEYAYNKMGVVPINRPDSIFEKPNSKMMSAFKSIVRLLMMGQAVVIFPEGWPNVDSHWTKKTNIDEIIEVKAGLFHFIDYVQKKTGAFVPIVPIGIKYEKQAGLSRTKVFVNIGTPFNIPVFEERIDFQPYLDKLHADLVALSNMAE